MRVWRRRAGQYERFPKNYGWSCFDDAAMLAALTPFFVDDEDGRVRVDVVRAFVEQLGRVRAFVARGEWAFYASSVLFVYEGGASEVPPTVRMIDFAHTVEVCCASSMHCF